MVMRNLKNTLSLFFSFEVVLMKEKIYKFEKFYRAKVTPSNMRVPIYPSISDYRYEDKFYNYECKSESIPAVNIYISEKDFNVVLEKLDTYSDSNKEWRDFEQCNKAFGPGWIYNYNTLLKDKKTEEKLREKYPSVKKAWEQYQLVLKLCEN